MAVGVKSWSLTAASNANADANINWAEGMLAPQVNNSARAEMAAVKAMLNTLGGAVTYGGSSNAYTITNDAVGAWSTYTAPSIVMLKANHTNTGAATVNVDGLGPTAIVTSDGGALIAGDITSGGLYLLCYDGTSFQVIGTIAGGSYQPLDATLTAIAALVGSSGQVMRWTGTDTFTLDTTSAAGRSLWNFTDPNADQLIFWDDSVGALTGITTLTGLSISGTTLAVSTNLQTWSALAPSAYFQTLIDDADAATARGTLGLGTMSTQASSSVSISGGTITGITDITVADGGTGSSTAAGARTNLGLVIGTNVQAYAANLTTWAGLAPSAYFQTLIDDADAATARGTLGLGTMSTQAASSVSISGGSITGITDIAVADGGTGSSTAAGARTNLGLVIGTDVQAYNSNLTGINQALTSSSSPTFANPTVTTIELGATTDTTLSRLAAGQMGVEGKAAIQHNGAYTSGQVTFSTSSASGGSSGDIWFKYT